MKQNSNIKISFVMSLHDEEKIIYSALNELLSVPYWNYEILVGLDSCTDNTEAIVRMVSHANKKLKMFKFEEHRGKNEVINDLIKQASGEIIIVTDADWAFYYKDIETLQKFIKLFDNPWIGGIAESFAVTWPLRESMPLLEKGITIQNSLWINYLKEKGIPFGDFLIANKKEHPFLVNIFRKKLFRPNSTLGDDFERCINIWNSNKIVLVAKEDRWPRMISSGEKFTMSGILKQKKRTAMAREQLNNKYKSKSLLTWDFIKYVVDHLKDYDHIKDSRKSFWATSFLFLLGMILSKFSNKKTTKDGWSLRGR